MNIGNLPAKADLMLEDLEWDLETISKPPAGFARLQSAWICVALNRPITEDRAHSGALPTPISLALGPHSVF